MVITMNNGTCTSIPEQESLSVEGQPSVCQQMNGLHIYEGKGPPVNPLDRWRVAIENIITLQTTSVGWYKDVNAQVI